MIEDATHQMQYSAAQEEYWLAIDKRRPFYMLRPRLSIDGNQWCALYGENLQDGVAGFGNSPADAAIAFDKAWVTPIGAKP